MESSWCDPYGNLVNCCCVTKVTLLLRQYAVTSYRIILRTTVMYEVRLPGYRDGHYENGSFRNCAQQRARIERLELHWILCTIWLLCLVAKCCHVRQVASITQVYAFLNSGNAFQLRLSRLWHKFTMSCRRPDDFLRETLPIPVPHEQSAQLGIRGWSCHHKAKQQNRIAWPRLTTLFRW